ncbi:MAG: hypothetical protein OHM57_02580 [Spiroplasma phoeniceum]|nr:MAG: hypothetical protein OHM57_02580 [Spiroplasma phoeniceum]
MPPIANKPTTNVIIHHRFLFTKLLSGFGLGSGGIGGSGGTGLAFGSLIKVWYE